MTAVTTALHISFAQQSKAKPRKAKNATHMDPHRACGKEECIRVDESGKRVFVGRGEVSFAHRQCSVFDFDHIGVSPQHSSTFLHVVAPMVFDFVEAALPMAAMSHVDNGSSSHQQFHNKGGQWMLDSPRRRSNSSSHLSVPPEDQQSITTTHHTANTVFVYGHSSTDRLDLYRYIVEHIAEAASGQVRGKNLKHANNTSTSHHPHHDYGGSGPLLELSFSFVDAFHVWGIADVLDPSSFLHDVNGTRSLNAMKRSNGSKGLPFVLPTRKSLGNAPASVKDDISEVSSAVYLRRGLKILYRQAEVLEHKQSSSAIMTFFCASKQRSSVLHVVLLPEADAPSSMNRVGSQLSAVSTTLQQLQSLSGEPLSSASLPLSGGIDSSSFSTNGSSSRIPMRESPVLMYLMQTEDYYHNERAARFRVAQHNRLLDVELSKVNTDSSFSRKHIPSTTPRRQAPIASIFATPSSHGFPALPSAALAHTALGNVALVVAINCAIEEYPHVLSACHFARRSQRPRGPQSLWHMDTSSTSLGKHGGSPSSKESSPGRHDHLVDVSFGAHSQQRASYAPPHLDYNHDEGIDEPMDPLRNTLPQRPQDVTDEKRERRHVPRRQQQQQQQQLSAAAEDHHHNGDPFPFGSHEPSSIEHSKLLASHNATTVTDSPYRPGSYDEGNDEETSVERAFRQVVVRAATQNISSHHAEHGNPDDELGGKFLSPVRHPSQDASTMVVLSPASPATTQTDSLAHAVEHVGSQVRIAGVSTASQTFQPSAVGDGAASTKNERKSTFAVPATRAPPLQEASMKQRLEGDAPASQAAAADAEDDDFERLAANIATMGELLSNGQPHAPPQGQHAPPHQLQSRPPMHENAPASMRSDAGCPQQHSMRLESPQFDFDLPEIDDFISRSQSGGRGNNGGTTSRADGGAPTSSNKGGGLWSAKSSVSSKQFDRHDDQMEEDDGELLADDTKTQSGRTSPSPRHPISDAHVRAAGGSSTPPHAPPRLSSSASAASYPMLVEKLSFERDSLTEQVKRLERELFRCQSTNEELRDALTERQDHARRLASKLEDLSNHRQHAADELVASHCVQQKFFKEQLEEALVRHETITQSMQATILTLSKEKMMLERDLVTIRGDVMNRSNQNLACETLQSHINILHAQIEGLNAQHDQEREELTADARQWKRKAESLLHELSMCRSAKDEQDAAIELRKTEERMKVELFVEKKVRDATQHQAATLDAERRARLAAEHESFQLRLQIQALNSRLAFFEEQVAPEVDLSIKELEEQMQRMHEHRTRFQRTLQTTLTRSSVSSSPATAACLSGSEEIINDPCSTRLFTE